MNHLRDSALHDRCQAAFLAELIRTIEACVRKAELSSENAEHALIENLAFAIAAHLSGSSFAGRVDDEEVYPVIGFSKGELDDATYFGGRPAHEFVASILANRSDTK